MSTASSINAQYMAVASISTLRSRSVLGLAPSIPFTPLQTRLQLFRTITTETRQSTTSTQPPPPSTGASKTSTTVATKPPLSPAPPSPPLPISSIPPKIVDVAAEKVQEKAVKRDEKPKKGLPARAWAKVKEEASHYWHGTKLLGQEIKISAKLQYKVLQGSTLTRRERRQASLSPFSIGIMLTNIVEANNYGSTAFDPFLTFRPHPLYGVLAPRSTQALPQHASIHL
jgi:hypothetical protein